MLLKLFFAYLFERSLLLAMYPNMLGVSTIFGSSLWQVDYVSFCSNFQLLSSKQFFPDNNISLFPKK